jgi:hypothetical protein
MRLITGTVLLVMLIALVTGCATVYPRGVIYTELKLPVIATGEIGREMKIGTAECRSVMGIMATGDASIATAMKNGGITKVYYVDWQVENILGLIGKYKVTVYGE